MTDLVGAPTSLGKGAENREYTYQIPAPGGDLVGASSEGRRGVLPPLLGSVGHRVGATSCPSQEPEPWFTPQTPTTADASPPGARPRPSSASSAARTSNYSRASWASPPPPCPPGGTTSWPAARPPSRAGRPMTGMTRSPGCGRRSAS